MFEQIPVKCPYCGEALCAPLEHCNPVLDLHADCPICWCPIIFRATFLIDGRFQRVLAVRNLPRESIV